MPGARENFVKVRNAEGGVHRLEPVWDSGGDGDVEGGEILTYDSDTHIASILLDSGETVDALMILSCINEDDYWMVHGTLVLAGGGTGEGTFDWSGDVVFPTQPIPSWAVQGTTSQAASGIYGQKIKAWVTDGGGNYTGFTIRCNQNSVDTTTFHWKVEGFA